MKKSICPKCKEKTMKHLHDTAYGMEETHMKGSERFECICGLHISSSKEAEKYNLKFILDK